MIGVIWSDDARAREKHRSIYMPFEGPDLDQLFWLKGLPAELHHS